MIKKNFLPTAVLPITLVSFSNLHFDSSTIGNKCSKESFQFKKSIKHKTNGKKINMNTNHFFDCNHFELRRIFSIVYRIFS